MHANCVQAPTAANCALTARNGSFLLADFDDNDD